MVYKRVRGLTSGRNLPVLTFLTPWVSNCLSSNIIDWQFSCLSHFLSNDISFPSGKAEMKKLRRPTRQSHFLGTYSPDSFLPGHFALCRLRTTLKSEPACRLWFPAARSGPSSSSGGSLKQWTSNSDKSKQVFEKDEDAWTRSSLCATKP